MNHNRMEKRAQRLEDTGQFRVMESTGGKFTRGFKPEFGEVRKVQDIQGAVVIDDQNKDHLTKFVLPVSETTEDAGPRRIEQKGSAIVDNTRRARLKPFAEKLVELLRRRRGAVAAATASKFLGEQRGFREAMAGVPSFGALVKLFPYLTLVTAGAGGASTVRVTKSSRNRLA